MNIFVGNLPFRLDEDELQRAFETYGAVDRVKIVLDRETGKSRGFAFVEMPDDAAAQQAIEALDNTEMGGRPLKVNEARPREDRPAAPRMGGGGGGFERRGGGGGGGFRSGGPGGGGGGRGGPRDGRTRRGGDRGGFDRGGY